MGISSRRLPLDAVVAVALLLPLVGCSPRVVAPPEPPPYSVRRGEIAFQHEDYPTAIAHYRAFLTGNVNDPHTARIYYKVALSEYRLGRYLDSLGTLDEITERYPTTRWVQVEALRGDAFRELERPMAALTAWDEAWQVADDPDRPKLRRRVIALSHNMSDAELMEGQQIVTDPELQALLVREASSRHPVIDEEVPDYEGETEEVVIGEASDLAAPDESEPGTPPAAAAAAAPATAADRTATRPKVGVLLPLSGAAQALGERSLRSLNLVFDTPGEQLVVMDTESNPQTAARKFAELRGDPNVVAIIGPAHDDEVAAVGPLAYAAQIPTLLLSQHDGMERGAVLQVGATRSQLIDTLLGYATGNARLRHYGLLYPDNDQGRETAARFRTAAERRGATIVGTDPYSPATRALSAGMLKRWRDSKDLQAVFVADDATTAHAVARILQQDMPDVPLLGIQGWESLADRDGEAVNGVLFSSPFYSGSPRPETQAFIERFAQAYGQTPDSVEAQAYDAALLAGNAIEAGARSRREVLQTLWSHGPIDGTTGTLTVTTDGLQRELVVLRVYDGKLEAVTNRAR